MQAPFHATIAGSISLGFVIISSCSKAHTYKISTPSQIQIEIYQLGISKEFAMRFYFEAKFQFLKTSFHHQQSKYIHTFSVLNPHWLQAIDSIWIPRNATTYDIYRYFEEPPGQVPGSDPVRLQTLYHSWVQLYQLHRLPHRPRWWDFVIAPSMVH